MSTSPRRRLGFTLVELLVVIAIIGLLVGMLVPAVQSARERARQTQCLNNVKNMALAIVNYDSSKGQFPGLTQFIKRNQTDYASVANNMTSVIGVANPKNLNVPNVRGFSWATVILPRLERQDIWDQIQNPTSPEVPMPPIAAFICPSDRDVTSQSALLGLSYSANSGAWDRSGNTFLYSSSQKSGRGDTADNGVFFDLAELGRQQPAAKIPTMRMSAIKDGAGTTIMLAENIHKTYYGGNTNLSRFSWLTGNEQQLGIVWVVPTNGTAPVPGNTINNQERINGNQDDVIDFPFAIPRFAIPSSAHSNGVNIAFCDGRGQFLREDIDYVVYQQLMTPNGRKCVDPTDHSISTGAIQSFRNAPPLAEKDYN